ncbi:MAG: CopG family transcriptional regulator [Clostridiales bacterium]|nr:CopG family transcriptional regulator [Clostridiales bacterium]
MSDFIPKQYKKDAITIRMDLGKLAKIDELASKYGLSRSEFINQCIDYALDHMPSPEEQKNLE